MKRIAVVLCGSGYRDGSEIRESVGVLWALSPHGVQVQCFAPNAPQADVVNCYTGKTAEGETRNQLVEAARIARGKVKPLSELNPADFDGIVLPGGFGAAKNLCNFATKGSRAEVSPELQRTLESMFASRKPIGAICIAPALVAIALKGKGLELTVGGAGEVPLELEKLGHKHVVTKASECHIDTKNRLATTAAYMYDDAPLHEIFQGIQKVVDYVVQSA